MITQKPANNTTTFVVFSIVFFGWGLLTSLNGVLVGHLNAIFELDSFRSSLINYTFFGAFFLISLIYYIISSQIDILRSLGYKYLTLVGLAVSAMGAYLFYPASALLSFPFFLFALFLLATGITILQISANTYVSILMKDQLGSSRLSLVQAVNSVGATMGPAAGAILISNSINVTGPEIAMLHSSELLAFKQMQGTAVQLPYWLIATALFLLAALIFFLRMPDIASINSKNTQNPDAGAKTNLLLAVLGIFVYVGAEVAIGSKLGFVIENLYPALKEDSAFLVTSYWALMMVGRFVGGLLLRIINTGWMIFAFGIMSILLLLLAMFGTGEWTVYLLVGIGFFNSIMFPAIFAAGIGNLHDYTGKGASLLIMAIVGGGIIPSLYIFMTSVAGIKGAMIIMVICYVYIAFYGKYFQKFSVNLK